MPPDLATQACNDALVQHVGFALSPGGGGGGRGGGGGGGGGGRFGGGPGVGFGWLGGSGPGGFIPMLPGGFPGLWTGDFPGGGAEGVSLVGPDGLICPPTFACCAPPLRCRMDPVCEWAMRSGDPRALRYLMSDYAHDPDVVGCLQQRLAQLQAAGM